MCVLGVMGGIRWGGSGVVLAYAICLSFGSLALLWTFHRAEPVAAKRVSSAGNLKAIGLSAVLAFCGFVGSLLAYSALGRVAMAAVALVALVAIWAVLLASSGLSLLVKGSLGAILARPSAAVAASSSSRSKPGA
jgi:hypothetical protein